MCDQQHRYNPNKFVVSSQTRLLWDLSYEAFEEGCDRQWTKYLPLTPLRDGLVAKWIDVKAPWYAVFLIAYMSGQTIISPYRSSQCMFFETSVITWPGWRQLTVRELFLFLNFRSSSYVHIRHANFARPYAENISYPFFIWGSLKSKPDARWCRDELTFTILPSLDSSSLSSSRWVRRKGPRWLAHRVVSFPSLVSFLSCRSIPALFMSTWSFKFNSLNLWTKVFMDSTLSRSNGSHSTLRLPDASMICWTAFFAFAYLS